MSCYHLVGKITQTAGTDESFFTVVDLNSYPTAAFAFAMTVGLLFVRRQRHRLGLGHGEFRAWYVLIVISIFVNLYLLIMPWYPPDGGRFGGDVSFWYATYVVTGIAM